MILLAPTTDSLKITTSSATTIEYHISYAEHSSSSVTAVETAGSISSATTTTVFSASPAGVKRQVRGINIINTSSFDTVTVTVQIDVSGSATAIFKCILKSGESANFAEGRGWHSLSDHGRTRENAVAPYPEGYNIPILKIGNATEAAGVMYFPYASNLFPPQWLPGNPGAAGRAVNSEDGRLEIGVPLTGYAYLEGLVMSSNVATSYGLIDILWLNTGLSTTTTTAQTVNSATFASRDLQESSNGRGVEIGILVTTVTSNAAAVTTITMSYTNADGTGSKTATISSFPATCVAGSLIPFQLAAGDNGVRSIQSLTLGASLGTSAISLVAFRRVMTLGCYSANSAARVNWSDDGVRILSGSTIMPIQIPTATTATTIQGTAYIHNMD